MMVIKQATAEVKWPSAIARFFAKGPKGKLTDHKTRFGPGNTDNRNRRQRTCQPPAQAHKKATKYQPDNIAKCFHHFPIVNTASLQYCSIAVLQYCSIAVFSIFGFGVSWWAKLPLIVFEFNR
jgi:hypothetical protein